MIFLYFKIHLHIYLSLLNVFFVFTHEMNYQLLIIIFLINIMIIFFSVQLVMSVRTIWTSPSPSLPLPLLWPATLQLTCWVAYFLEMAQWPWEATDVCVLMCVHISACHSYQAVIGFSISFNSWGEASEIRPKTYFIHDFYSLFRTHTSPKVITK